MSSLLENGQWHVMRMEIIAKRDREKASALGASQIAGADQSWYDKGRKKRKKTRMT